MTEPIQPHRPQVPGFEIRPPVAPPAEVAPVAPQTPEPAAPLADQFAGVAGRASTELDLDEVQGAPAKVATAGIVLPTASELQARHGELSAALAAARTRGDGVAAAAAQDRLEALGLRALMALGPAGPLTTPAAQLEARQLQAADRSGLAARFRRLERACSGCLEAQADRLQGYPALKELEAHAMASWHASQHDEPERAAAGERHGCLLMRCLAHEVQASQRELTGQGDPTLTQLLRAR